MKIIKILKSRLSGNNIVPLVAVTLLFFFYLILLLAFNYITIINDMESVIVQGDVDSRKMRLNSELMEIARARTRITNQVIDIEDPFEQDELNLELDRLASKFALLREELLGLELTDLEQQILLEDHPRIIGMILPAQREAVDLAISDGPGERQRAREILYQSVLPGQGLMVDSLRRLISLEQRNIEALARQSLDKANETRESSYLLIAMVISVSLFVSIAVLIYLRKTQRALLGSYQNLEQKVRERTDDLTRARDDLQRYVDLVDKYVITSHTDAQGFITYTSKAFCRISQYSEDELIGRPHSIVRHSDMPKSLYQDLWKTIRQGKSWQGEIKNRAKDGSAYWVDVNIEPQFDADQNVTGYVAVRQDITDHKRIEELSVTDALTQLSNRLKLDETLSMELDRAERYQLPLSIILFDVDHFKKVNDSFGHQVGDSVLKQIAEIVRHCVRTTDVAGRWGGEEFLIICCNTERKGAIELAERIRLAMDNYEFDEAGHVTGSFGVATLCATCSADDILSEADAALYRAKEKGRNRVEVADSVA